MPNTIIPTLIFQIAICTPLTLLIDTAPVWTSIIVTAQYLFHYTYS